MRLAASGEEPLAASCTCVPSSDSAITPIYDTASILLPESDPYQKPR